MQGYSLCEVGILCQYPHIQRLNLASNDLTGGPTPSKSSWTSVQQQLLLYGGL